MILNWYVRTLNRILERLGKKNPNNPAVLIGDLDTVSTQENKPSPHSSYELGSLLQKFKEVFPQDFQYSFVANTNSMEPMFDDNCVVVLEPLTKARKTRQPLIAGDVVTYEGVIDGTKFSIIHMLNQYRYNNGNKEWLIWGLNNHIPDGWILESNLQHRLVAVGYGKAKRRGD